MKSVHVHLHTQDSEERWVTISGTHVKIGEGGKITAGPKALMGKSKAEAAAGPHKYDRKAGQEHSKATKTRQPEKAHASVKERREGLESSGFKHERTEGSPDDLRGQQHHFAHPDGARALITHKSDHEGHSVSSYVNETNAGKKKPAAKKAKAEKPAPAPEPEQRPWDGTSRLEPGHVVGLEGEDDDHDFVVLESIDDRGDMPVVLVESTKPMSEGSMFYPQERVSREFLIPRKK